ncbi:MAG: DUF4258 domain-containing protein [Myxococcales bacterium]|nr:DUF4258 domain-containing protein [Myxococcales bacterium]
MWWLFACGVVEPVPAPTPISAPSPTPSPRIQPVVAPDDGVSLMRSRPLGFTHHARCRMDCRHFDEGEVEEILKNGVVDPSRTRFDGKCPSYALEGTTSDGQHARMVFGACERNTPVITVIDLDTDWPCDC